MSSSAKVILDSISPRGDRLITFEGEIHRFILAELNTHRQFSRNSASSRAVPISKQIGRVLEDPAMPIEWGLNQPGMQAEKEASEEVAQRAKKKWLAARDAAVHNAQLLACLDIHKQIVNRLLEPFMWHKVIISTTTAGLENFFAQRSSAYSPLAQPEMRAFADAVLEAYKASTPTPLGYGEWHLPYIGPDERDLPVGEQQLVSVARCARVSYLTHNGERHVGKDLDLAYKLMAANPMHASPFEHVARPAYGYERPLGNFQGWWQLRHHVEGLVVDADALAS